jgi:ribosomal protein L37AE/L43A
VELFFNTKKEVIDIVNVKVRSTPMKIILLEVLKRRLPLDHSKKNTIEQELSRRKAGLWGEREVDNKLKKIDPNKYYIFCDIRLPHGDSYFQIDTLIISKNSALIIEAKNISGTLYFDLENHLFYRKNDDGSTKVFPDPVSQARLLKQLLREWLIKHKLPLVPIEFLVVSCNPYSYFWISPTNHPYAKKICSIAGLTWEIDNLAAQYEKEIITDNDIRKISKAILKADRPLEIADILKQYNIAKSEILTGAHCPECEFLPLLYRRGKWYCQKCNKHFKDTHHLAMKDYFLLYDSTITNSQFRNFLHLNNPDVAKKMLKSMNLEMSGINKGRVYQMRATVKR